MRHGHALTAREAGVPSDPERPLSPLGERETLETARHLGASGFVPDLIISSPFLRADRTAAIAAGVFPGASRRTNTALSDGQLGALLDLAQQFPPGSSRILLVGHQPLLGAVAGLLLGGEVFDLSPAGFVRLKTDGNEDSSLVEFYAPPPEGKNR